MTGDQLKRKLKAMGISVAEAARKLDIGHQNLTQALNAQDVKTGLVERLSKALNLPVSYFFDDKFVVSPNSASGSVHGDTNCDYSKIYRNGNVSTQGGDGVAEASVGSLLALLVNLVVKQEAVLAETKSIKADFIAATAELNQATSQNKAVFSRLSQFLGDNGQAIDLAAESPTATK